MNYFKWLVYTLIFMLFFYPLVEIASPSVKIFGSGFFTLTGFIAVFLFALTETWFSAYSYDFGRKKDADEKQNS